MAEDERVAVRDEAQERGTRSTLASELDEIGKRARVLERQLEDANAIIGALTRGEIDAITPEGSATPLLLHEAQQKLRASEHLLRAVFDGALDAMLLIDGDGKLVEANPAACSLYGLPLAQLLRRSITALNAQIVDSEESRRAFLAEGHMRGQVPFSREDGSARILDYSAAANVSTGLHLVVLRDITDRVAAEERQRRTDALFRAVIEKSKESISLTSADGTTQHMTTSAARMLGRTTEEMATRSMRDEAIPEDRARVASVIKRLIAGAERDVTMEFRVRHRDGSILWVEASSTNLLDDPDVGAIVSHYREITARKAAEDALRTSRDLLEEAQAIAHVGSWTSGMGSSGVLSWSAECYRIFGIQQDTPMTVGSFFETVHPEDRLMVQNVSDEAIVNGTPYDVAHRIQWPDGRVRWVHERASVERDAFGRTTRLVGTVQDITDSRLAIDALRLSEERYRRIIETTSEGVWMSDANLITTFVNQPMADMLGYARDEMVGQPVFAFLTAEGAELARTKFERRRRGTAETYQNTYRRKDGTTRWALAKTNAIFEDGRFMGTVGLLTDMTEQRKLDEARAHLVAIVESSDDAIFSRDLAGRILSWNAGAERLYGYPASEMIGHVTLAPVPADRRAELATLFGRVVAGGEVGRVESVRIRKDGTTFDAAITICAIKNSNGDVVGTSIITRDLTERKRAEEALRGSEERLRQAQKMEAIGNLAGGVAHDFNNLLSVILSYTSLILDDLPPHEPIRADLNEVYAAGMRATELTRQLLAFSRQQVLSPRVLNVNPIVSGLEKMLGRLLGEGIAFSVFPSETLGRVNADPGQLEQVIMNLAVNARDAMPNGGSLTIETSNVTLDDSYAAAHPDVTPGEYVMLAVTDTGEGMSPATVARIFDPFFTTKERGKGTGLGLSTVYGIVHQSRGHIHVDSEPGKGTSFKVYLPRTDRAVDPERALLANATSVRGTETVLVVEDEEQVRAIVRAVLRRNGYNVLEAQNGGEAFLICETYGGKIDLLLTDVVMPRMSGRELADRVASLQPEMKVHYVSGYTDDSISHHGVLDSEIAFLQKPITPAVLLRRVRDVLTTARNATA